MFKGGFGFKKKQEPEKPKDSTTAKDSKNGPASKGNKQKPAEPPITEAQRVGYKKIFDKFDHDGDGNIGLEEVFAKGWSILDYS